MEIKYKPLVGAAVLLVSIGLSSCDRQNDRGGREPIETKIQCYERGTPKEKFENPDYIDIEKDKTFETLEEYVGRKIDISFRPYAATLGPHKNFLVIHGDYGGTIIARSVPSSRVDQNVYLTAQSLIMNNSFGVNELPSYIKHLRGTLKPGRVIDLDELVVNNCVIKLE